MGSFSIWHWIIVLTVILVVFGAGRLPSVMGDLAKGVKAFKAGMRTDADEGRVTAERSADEAAPATDQSVLSKPQSQA